MSIRFVGEVYGYDKQGAGYGYTHKRGYHPILATRAETGEVLHIRARKGSANTSRGALRFVEELIATGRSRGRHRAEAVARGLGILEHEDHGPFERAGWTYSIGVRLQTTRQSGDRGDPRAGLAARSRTTPRAGRPRSRRRCSAASG